MNILIFRELLEEVISDKKLLKQNKIMQFEFNDDDEPNGSIWFTIRTKNFEYQCEAFEDGDRIIVNGTLSDGPYYDINNILSEDIQYIEPFELIFDDDFDGEDMLVEIANQICDADLLQRFKKYQKYFDMFSNESSQDLANILKIGDYIG